MKMKEIGPRGETPPTLLNLKGKKIVKKFLIKTFPRATWLNPPDNTNTIGTEIHARGDSTWKLFIKAASLNLLS